MPVYNNFKKDVMNGSFALASDTIKVALCSSSYTPDIDAHDNFDDITNEVSASGTYAAGGGTLAGAAVTVDNTNNRGVFDANDLAFTGATIDARYAIIYKSTGVASTSKLIGYIDFTTDQSCSAGTFTLQWHANGILLIS